MDPDIDVTVLRVISGVIYGFRVRFARASGTLPVMVLKVDPENTGIIIATGDAPFGQYMGLYKPEMLRADRYGDEANPQQGGRLYENIVDYAVQYSGVLFNYENTVEASDGDIAVLQTEIISLQGDKDGLEADVDALEDEVSDLERDVSNLEEDITGLEGQISDLGDEMSTLTADVEAKKSTVNTWQIYAVVLLIISLAVGYLAESMMIKS